MGRDEESLRFLALAALNDIQRGITEYTSLPRLAIALSEQGDVVRAYDYLLCTMDDANFCKARLRSFEASSVFPIIERAHKAKVREQQYVATVIAILVGIVLLISATLPRLYRHPRQLSPRTPQTIEGQEIRPARRATSRQRVSS